ncbi:IS66 family insertion sequence element accessory protein TnpB [Legionella israelensis]|uniref:IS66 family insertion sequence element accessory protein TnpB n=1 Tax=Legionella israelensis TaxID=454 RepID=UPI000E1B6DF6|nr:IS66 family insertion sequence element accessory protein TnpB [Legionella israelensis]
MLPNGVRLGISGQTDKVILREVLTFGRGRYKCCAYRKRQRLCCNNTVDFRKKPLNGLAAMVIEEFESPANDGSVYVFYNRSRDRVKCLFWGYRMVLCFITSA